MKMKPHNLSHNHLSSHLMKQLLNHRITSWLPTALVGCVLAFIYFFLLSKDGPLSGFSAFLIFLYLWAVFSLVVYVLWFKVLTPRLRAYTNRWKLGWFFGCLLAGGWLAVNIPIVFPLASEGSTAPSGLLKLLFTVGAAIGIGLGLFAVSVFFATQTTSPTEAQARPRLRWLFFALPIFSIWVIYLLAFWPGMMSADSLDQWGQVLSGVFNDHHPAFHTFTIWLLTRIALSPAVVALAQIVALSLVAGGILAYLESMGVPPLWLWTASFLFAISPVNGTMVNTLWKDIPYSAALLGLTFLVFRLANSGGKWIAKWSNWLIFGITAALVILFRHNGLPVILGLFLLLLLGFYHQWKPLALAFAVCMGLYFIITGPIYQLMQVQQSEAALLENSISLYSIAARADPGTKSEMVLSTMQSFSGNWECSIISQLNQADQNDSKLPQGNFGEKAINLVRFSPALLLYDYRCNRSLIWIIWDPHGEVRDPSHAEYLIDSNSYGLLPDSKIPVLQTAISDFVARTAHDTEINWLVWRPALYLYLFFAVIAIHALRYKKMHLLFAALPILLQSIALTAVPSLPNFRYDYATYLVALIFWPVLFAPLDYSASPQINSDGTEAEHAEMGA
jgi:hypothetical protein